MSRTLVRYTIPLDSSSQSHRLGVNSLAIDPSGSGTLYSAGRDGIIAAWNLNMSLSHIPNKYDDTRTELQVASIEGDTTFKRGIQAHTNWVNQIAISPDYQSIYSCSSDTFIKCWRPNAYAADQAATLGSHTDYVKCLVPSKSHGEWVATAGLDRNILMWDTNGSGEKMRIDASSIDGGMQQSVYSLAAGPNLVASGGIEKVIRVWDTRSGSRITKFVGHTDNVRSLMCSEDGRIFISAASDTTIKIWDLTAGRCLHTLNVHADPVWTLASDHPQLAVFHSADRSGLILKNDLRPQTSGGNDGECNAICRETSGVNSLAQIGANLFAATASSSINRWKDLEVMPTNPFEDPGEALSRIESSASCASNTPNLGPRGHPSFRLHRKPPLQSLASMTKASSSVVTSKTDHENQGDPLRRARLRSRTSVVSLLAEVENDVSSLVELKPLRTIPEDTIQGQAGLIAYDVLSDRRRVLTRDTDGKVKMWDITECRQISDFGLADIGQVADKMRSEAAVGSWCSVNTRMGALTVEMDPRSLLDAETYLDAIASSETLDFEARNQRFNLGKWMLKSLFEGVIEAEKARDATECAKLRHRRPARLNLGDLSNNRHLPASQEASNTNLATPTFGSRNPYASAMSTPGASIGLATPAPIYNPKPNGNGHKSEGSVSSLASGKDSVSSPTTPGDYFSSPHGSRDPDATPTANAAELSAPGDSQPKTPGGSLMKNMKWLRSSKSNKLPTTTPENKKQSFSQEGLPVSTPTSATSSPSQKPDEPPKNFRQLVEQNRKRFVEASLKIKSDNSEQPSTWMAVLERMPQLKIPPNVEISLANFQPGEGEAKDIYRGTVGGLAGDLDNLTPLLPLYIGQILLLNDIPAHMQNLEGNKHYFSFVPHAKSKLLDPFNTPSGGGMMRLGAARSLRIRKALTYISQRLSQEVVENEGAGRNEEEWLEIVVNGTPVDPDWTLMMTRRHLWKQGGDMKLEYKLKSEH